MKQVLLEEIELESHKLQEAKSQMEILIGSVQNSNQIKKRDLKGLQKSKELTIKLDKSDYKFEKTNKSPYKASHISTEPSSLW